ncbi:zinc ribbon domain-containing protein [Jeotgalicoccus sp. ATCC 8456]|uniref:zinc ribbon domain-containing protein n=1 Tax=Jeotgalicoccus sp. ATCC 8456 TaxID=946435 RepID=UPI0018E632CD|nr:zinc ribbon domain-containing protein [Jeotgalicoccus sp. ATCC 8456]QQD85643.1 zinc ribbon domain-containing protein [Jeotgalicoccus sp. ATCC 8456]
MLCPNCKKEVLESDKFCGHCGLHLGSETHTQTNPKLKVGSYTSTFVKTPSKVIETPRLFNIYTMLTTVGILILLIGFLSFVYLEGFYLNFGTSLGIFLRAVFIYVGILVLYLFALLLTSYISSSKSIDFKDLFKSYLSLSVIALVAFTVSLVLSILNVSYIPLTFNIFALMSLSIGTYYIYKTQNTTSEKFDSFYVLIIHIVIVGVVTHLIYNYWINQIFTNAFNL